MTTLRRDGVVVVETVILAHGLFSRMKGLLGRSSLGDGHGMHLLPCSGIHTLFMRFSIDLIFLSRDLEVVRLVRNVRPWRMVTGGCGAHSVVEVESGWLPADYLKVGDRLELG